jgi:hypothetical protein
MFVPACGIARWIVAHSLGFSEYRFKTESRSIGDALAYLEGLGYEVERIERDVEHDEYVASARKLDGV